MTSEKVVREKPIPEAKKALVAELTNNITSNRTVLVASCKGLPGKQFHDIKKKLRSSATIKVARKTAIERAIDGVEKGTIKGLKEQLEADIVVLFSDLDPFALSGILSDNQSPKNAKAGDIAPEDIAIEPQLTDLPPGPAISELGSVGLKVKVSDGKLEITQGAVVAKEGDEIDQNTASVLSKLGVTPMKVGFIPLAAYDSQDNAVYVDIKIDKEATLEALRDMLGKALGFAVNVEYPAAETISYFIAKANAEEQTLSRIVDEKNASPQTEDEPKNEETTEEPAPETTEENTEEKKEDTDSTKEDTKEDA